MIVDTRLLVAALMLGATYWSFKRWRQALEFVPVLLVLEGALRKWVFPGAQDLVYLGKDVLLIAAYVGYLSDRRRARVHLPPLLHATIVAGAAFCALEILNPRLPNLLVGLIGFKAYFLYVPLAWIFPAVWNDSATLFGHLRAYARLMIPVGLLSVAQFMSPGDAAINAYARSGGSITTFGTSSHVRVTASFSYITGYTSFLIATVILTLALLAATRWRLERRTADLYAVLALAFGGMFMTGSRGPLLTMLLLFPVYFWLSLAREGNRDVMLGRILLGLGLVAALLNQVGADAVNAFYGRASTGTDVTERLILPLLSPVEALGPAGLAGYGIGACHQAAEALTRGIEPYSWLDDHLVEDEPGRIMLELGPLGFLLIYFVRVYVIFAAFEQVFRLRSSFHRAMAASAAMFFLAHLVGGIVFNVTADVYYWYFVGLLMAVVRLDRLPAGAVAAPPAKPRLARPLSERGR